MNDRFRRYLDAEYLLDSRSLNREVLDHLKQKLGEKRTLRCLDLGTGTGAMIKRLIEWNPGISLEIMGLDCDVELLCAGALELNEYLHERGFRTEHRDFRIVARSDRATVNIHLEHASVLDWDPIDYRHGFELVSAHAFLDLVPLNALCERIRHLLARGGLFYGTLNYDGETVLIPVYSDEALERKILEHYDRSMEIRRVQGLPTGGAQAGRRLIGAMAAAGFDMHSYGSSDWNISPVGRVYRDRDAHCLKDLLAMIHGEATRNGAFDPVALDRWYAERIRRVDAGTLGMIVHQLDVLAVRSDCPAV